MFFGKKVWFFLFYGPSYVKFSRIDQKARSFSYRKCTWARSSKILQTYMAPRVSRILFGDTIDPISSKIISSFGV